MKRFACGDVVPGCSHTFAESSDDRLMAAVARHAARDHGLTEVGPELLASIRSHIHAA